jgi:hypothetical protein
VALAEQRDMKSGSVNLDEVQRRAREVERQDHATGVTCISRLALHDLIRHAERAREVALQMLRRVWIWNREMMPTVYRWRYRRYTRWTVTASPAGVLQIAFLRMNTPANDRSFLGVEARFEGLSKRDILWQAGRQRERVLRFDEEIIKAALVVSNRERRVEIRTKR